MRGICRKFRLFVLCFARAVSLGPMVALPRRGWPGPDLAKENALRLGRGFVFSPRPLSGQRRLCLRSRGSRSSTLPVAPSRDRPQSCQARSRRAQGRLCLRSRGSRASPLPVAPSRDRPQNCQARSRLAQGPCARRSVIPPRRSRYRPPDSSATRRVRSSTRAICRARSFKVGAVLRATKTSALSRWRVKAT